MSAVPHLCLRRIGPGRNGLTVGKLYPVEGVLNIRPMSTYAIHDDHGEHLETVGVEPFWQHVWLLPDGTELEALE